MPLLPEVCPLCHADNIIVIEKIKAASIIKMYQRLASLDVSSEFGSNNEILFCQCPSCDLHFFSPMVAGSGEFYDSLQKLDWYYPDKKDEYEVGSSFINSDFSVLEIGCGHGFFAQKIQVKKYVGLELSQDSIKVARKLGFEVLAETVQDHAIHHSGTYDAVCTFQVLEHVPEVDDFLQACVDCLKPGGVLIISVPSADSFLKRATNIFTNLPPHHVTWWTDKCLNAVGTRYGLEVVKLEHERLADIHLNLYLRTILLTQARRLFFLGSSMVNESLRYRMVEKAVAHLVKVWIKFAKFAEMPMGHSVNAVYRKPIIPVSQKVELKKVKPSGTRN